MNKNIPNDIQILANIEKSYNIVSLFKYKDTTAWISIKELLTACMYDTNIRLETNSKKEITSWLGIKTILISIKAYFFHLKSKEEKSLFLGASTGLFNFDKRVLDAYFPYYDMRESASIYMLNCVNLSTLNSYYDYTKVNNIIIENYIIVPFKKLFSKFLYIILPKKKVTEIKKFNIYLKTKNIDILDEVLLSKYTEFIAGVKLYKLFFKFLKIDKAYIVSASTKSDMVASLKSLNIEIIEIQHGIVGTLHRGYNFNFVKSELLPTVDKIDVYSQFWKDEIVNAGYFDSKSIKVVGRLKYDIVKSDIENLNFKYIIFTGQGAYFKQILQFFENADKLLVQKNIKLLYKAHPRELKSEIDFFKYKIKNLKSCLFYNDTQTTETLIKYSYAHVSIFSSCHFDAIYYKNKTYILDVMDKNIMNYYASTSPKKFIKIKSIEDILINE